MSIGNPNAENLAAAESELERLKDEHAEELAQLHRELQADHSADLERLKQADLARREAELDTIQRLRTRAERAENCIAEMIAADSLQGVQIAYARWKGPKMERITTFPEPDAARAAGQDVTQKRNVGRGHG